MEYDGLSRFRAWKRQKGYGPDQVQQFNKGDQVQQSEGDQVQQAVEDQVEDQLEQSVEDQVQQSNVKGGNF